MRVYGPTKFLLLLFLLLLLVAGVPADGIAATTQKRLPVDWVVAFDVTESVSPGDRLRWTDVADEEVGKNLQPGDSLSLFAIGPNTSERAPIVELLIPESTGKSLAKDLAARQATKNARQKLSDGLRSLNQQSKSKTTDVMGLFSRVRPMPGRKTVVLALTDAIESTKKVDFERVDLNTQAAHLIEYYIKLHHWDSASLAGVTFYINLDSSASPHLNSRASMREFYKQLISKLGGSLCTFDSAIGVRQLALAGGAR